MDTFDALQEQTNEPRTCLRPADAPRLRELALEVAADGTVLEMEASKEVDGRADIRAGGSAAVYAIDPRAGDIRATGEWNSGTAEDGADHLKFFQNSTRVGCAIVWRPCAS